MGAGKLNVAEQDWRESWEPILPAIAPWQPKVESVVGASELDGAWAQAERHFEYMVRLQSWMTKTKPRAAAVCADAELCRAIRQVERSILQVTSIILKNAA
jgi:hypothetical protein